MTSVYIIGSLRNPQVPVIGKWLREAGFDIFDDWFAAGPEADDYWKKYEEERGRNYEQALYGFAAIHVLDFDRYHLDRCDVGVLILPAGRSGHLELGYMAGKGKPTFVLMDDPERWDVMYGLCTKVCFDDNQLFKELHDVTQKPEGLDRKIESAAKLSEFTRTFRNISGPF